MNCRECRRRLSADERLAGREARCPHCKTINRVPEWPPRTGPTTCHAGPDRRQNAGRKAGANDGTRKLEADGNGRRAGEAEDFSKPLLPDDLLAELPENVGQFARKVAPKKPEPPRPRIESAWLYVLIGVGAAVPIVVLGLILIDLLR